MTIDCSPKFHPEIAGEGIEFCWGLSKNTYRRFSIEEKRTKSKYIELVKKCTCRDSIITKQMVRLFGKRTRRYMLAYQVLDEAIASKQATDNDDTENKNLPAMSSALVEKMIRVYKRPHKVHRNIADSQKEFLNFAASRMRQQN